MVSFEDLLIHTCELVYPGEVDGIDVEDSWGRPIKKDVEVKQIKCRYMTKTIYIRDASGSDQVVEMSMYLLPDTKVDPEMIVQNIKDAAGNLLTLANLLVQSINRHYDDQSLHHYKVILKGAE